MDYEIDVIWCPLCNEYHAIEEDNFVRNTLDVFLDIQNWINGRY